jgi:polysaccharide biosynthesis transport protein
MSLEYIFAVLRARWIIALGTFLVILGSVAAYTWLMPRTYTAVASVVLDIKNPDPIAGGVSPALASPTYMFTQIEIITSTRVAQKVVKNLKLDQVPELRQKWLETTGGTGSFDTWVAQSVKSSLEARPSRGSNVINFIYQATDPAFASTMVNAFMSAYLDTTMDLRTDPAKQYNQFFDANSKQLREKLEAAQGKLSSFQQRQGLIVTDERLDVEMGRLNSLASQLVTMETASADSGSRKNMVSSQQGGNTQEVMNSPLVASLKSEIVRAEATLGQLATRLGEQHPQVIELKANLDQLRAKLDIEVKRVSNSYALSNTMNQSREAQVKEAVEAQRAKVLKMKQVRDEAALLERDVLDAQRSYEGVVGRMLSTTLESQALQSNVAPLEYATPPSLPSSPRVTTNLAIGTALGLVLAVGLAFLIELVDKRLRTTSDVDALLQLPCLGTVPRFKSRGGDTRQIAKRFQLGVPALKSSAN